MKSELSKFDKIAIEQIEAIFESHSNDELTLVCCEFNNEVVVGFVDLAYRDINPQTMINEIGEMEYNILDSYFTIHLPVNLIEVSGYDEDDKLYSSYKFYPYKQIADEVCEVALKEEPSVIFFPNESIVKTYFTYWDRYKKSIVEKYTNNDIFDTITSTIS